MIVSQAVDQCIEVTRAHSRTFFLGSRLFPRQQRRAVSVVYAVCRAGDDAVDEVAGTDEARVRLETWLGQVDRAFAGRPRGGEPLEVALAWALEHYDIPRDAFDELHRGLSFDVTMEGIPDFDALMEYCRWVAGVVGLMIVPIAGYDGGAKTRAQAVQLGQAMQLTNILRDVGEDLARGRCYLPESWLHSYGVSVADLYHGAISRDYGEMIEALTHRAHGLYRSGWEGIPRLHGSAPAAVGVAALNYEGILHKLAQNRWDNLTRRAHLRSMERLALIPCAVVGAYVGI